MMNEEKDNKEEGEEQDEDEENWEKILEFWQEQDHK
jgi:hypothetical protein